MRYVLLDTSVYIDYWERGLYASTLEQIHRGLIVRHSSVVLSELYRGARTKKPFNWWRVYISSPNPAGAPNDEDWRKAGKILRGMGLKQGWEARKIRDFQNDTLIALTARRYGAAVVTANRSDFEEIRHYVQFPTIYV